jgi:hypothetical protein
MTIKRILHCTLIFMVLVTSGCGLFGDESTPSPEAKSSPSPLPKNEIKFANAADDVRSAVRQLSSPTKSASVKPVKEAINKAVLKLGKEEAGLEALCTDCTDTTKAEATRVLQSLTEMSAQLGPDDKKTVADLPEDLKRTLQRDLSEDADNLTRLSSAAPKSVGDSAAAPSATPNKARKGEGEEEGWESTIVWALEVAGSVLALVLLVFVAVYLWKRSWKRLEINVARIVKAHAAADRDGQPDYTSKFSSLSTTQAEMNTKLAELDTEVRSLARFVRESLARRPDRSPSYVGSNHQSQVGDVSLKDEPEFPVSAGDYLGKMNRFATVVRPDFQNGILVNDPDGTGELVLIRDSRQPDDTQPLFVVPSLTQFHTKQDFYTYYQKYYECVRPSGGDVWIIGPAVVEKVAGGWQLREKGMLEIR